MAKHNDLGKAGENAAAAYLEKEDYLIRHRNWRKGHFELSLQRHTLRNRNEREP